MGGTCVLDPHVCVSILLPLIVADKGTWPVNKREFGESFLASSDLDTRPGDKGDNSNGDHHPTHGEPGTGYPHQHDSGVSGAIVHNVRIWTCSQRQDMDASSVKIGFQEKLHGYEVQQNTNNT